MPEKRIRLSALDLKVPVAENVFFHDDGFVQDLNIHFAMKAASFSVTQREIEELFENRTILGRMRAFQYRYEKHFFIAYYKNKNEIQQLQTRGHEETHVLQATGNLGFLQEAMKKRAGLEVDFDRLHGRIKDWYEFNEVSADIGGLFAVHQEFGSERVINYYQGIAHLFKFFSPAFRVYKDAVNDNLPLLERIARKFLRV